MLRTSYDKLEDIPENLRGAYVPKDGKYVLDDLDDQHPVIVHNGTLTRERATDRTRITQLTNENSTLKGSSLPAGHRAVPEADAALLDKYKPLGTPDQLGTIITEHGTLKTKDGERQRQEHLRTVAGVLNFNPEAFATLSGLPELEIRDMTENGQAVRDEKGNVRKTVIAKIKNGEAITEKAFLDYFNETPTLKVFEPALKMAAGGGGQSGGGTRWASQSTGEPPKKESVVQKQIARNYPVPGEKTSDKAA
jgi:hypothetical protein